MKLYYEIADWEYIKKIYEFALKSIFLMQL